MSTIQSMRPEKKAVTCNVDPKIAMKIRLVPLVPNYCNYLLSNPTILKVLPKTFHIEIKSTKNLPKRKNGTRKAEKEGDYFK